MIRLQPRFAELAAMTNFSFLRGASHPEEMVARAAALGLNGIGIADRNTLAGVVRAHVYARENRAAIGALRVVTGARLVFTRRRARRARLSPGPRRLWAAVPAAHEGQSARAQGRVPSRAARPHRRERGPARHRDARRQERARAPRAIARGVRRAAVGRRQPDLWRGHARRARQARRLRARDPARL